MDTSGKSFKDSLKLLVSEIETIKKTPSRRRRYPQRISDVEHKFNTYYEEVTPKPALSDLYTCVGRLKFYGDQMLFIYLEILDNEKVQQLWPARATWKVELFDEDNDNIMPLTLGEATCLFNKPRHGFISHPSDWISIRYDQIQTSGLIGPDNSMTIRWSVLVEPVLQNIYLDRLELLEHVLKNAEQYLDFLNGTEINKIRDDLIEIKQKCIKHDTEILALETQLTTFNEKLDLILNKQCAIDDEIRNRSMVTKKLNVGTQDHFGPLK